MNATDPTREAPPVTKHFAFLLSKPMHDTTRLSREAMHRFLRDLPDAERGRMLNTFVQRRFRCPWWVLFTGLGAGLFLASGGLALLLLTVAVLLFNLSSPALELTAMVLLLSPLYVALVGAGALLDRIHAFVVRPYVTSDGRVWRLRRCPHCEQDQTGHASKVCPECGARVEYERTA